MSASRECPVCGNGSRNLANKVGQWKCSVCENIWTPNSQPTPAPVVAETVEAASLLQAVALGPVQQAQPRENASQQIRALHAHLKARLETDPEKLVIDPADLRELALDIHQALADAVAARRIQAGIDSLEPA